MKKRKIIAITGNIAGGKSQVVKKIAKKLGMGTYFASDNFRKLARQHNMDIVTFNEYVEKNSDIDKSIDKAMAEYLDTHDNLVVDSRLAWYFEKEAFKVFISVDIDVAAKRLAKDSVNSNVEDKYNTLEEAKNAIIKRQFYERDRYIKEYELISDTFYSEAFYTVLRKYLNVEFEKDWIGRLWAVVNPNINIDGKVDCSNVIIELDGENTNSNEYVKNWVYKQMNLIGELFKIEKLYDYIYIDFRHVGPPEHDNYLIIFDMSARIDFVDNLKKFAKHSILYIIIAAILWLLLV